MICVCNVLFYFVMFDFVLIVLIFWFAVLHAIVSEYLCIVYISSVSILQYVSVLSFLVNMIIHPLFLKTVFSIVLNHV